MYIHRNIPCKIVQFPDVDFYIIQTEEDGWLTLNLYENRGMLSLTHLQGLANTDHTEYESMMKTLNDTILDIQMIALS